MSCDENASRMEVSSRVSRSCAACKAQKNMWCLGRPDKYARECGRYKSVCPKCGGDGNQCKYCKSVGDYKKDHCISLDEFI